MFVKKSKLDDALVRAQALELRLELEQERRRELKDSHASEVARLEADVHYLRARVRELEAVKVGRSASWAQFLREEMADSFEDVEPEALKPSEFEQFVKRINTWEREESVEGATLNLDFLVPGDGQRQ